MKFAIKNWTEVTLNLSSNIIGDSNGENNFPHKLLLTNVRVSRLCKAFAKNSSANINYQKFNYIRWDNQQNFEVDFKYNY